MLNLRSGMAPTKASARKSGFRVTPPAGVRRDAATQDAAAALFPKKIPVIVNDDDDQI